jgi:hypothetical protein
LRMKLSQKKIPRRKRSGGSGPSPLRRVVNADEMGVWGGEKRKRKLFREKEDAGRGEKRVKRG